MVGYYGQGVPTSADLENNSNTKKYTVNQPPHGKIVLSKLACLFLTMGAIALAVIAALAVFIFVPGCIDASPEALTKSEDYSLGSSSTKNEIAAKRERQKQFHRKEEVNERLPRHLSPTHYKIKVMPFLIENNFTTSGFVSIDIKVKESTNKVVISAKDIEVDRSSLRVRHIKNEIFLRITDAAYNDEKQIYTIQLDRDMVKGEDYRVDIKYVSHLNDLMQGFYRSKYIDSTTDQVRWMASTQFSPTDARRAFPCFDEPDFKAIFTISVGRPGNMTSLSNMPKKDTVKSTEMEGWFWDNYNETPPMSTYLVAFIVSDLQPYEFSTNKKRYTIWARKEAINQAIYASTLIPKMLEYYENYFNIKFPLPKIDVVAVPDFGFSAMENWGLITFRESVLLLDTQVVTIDDYYGCASTNAHELSHQWFGNLVTPKWWDDLWLKEGFSTYFQFVGIDQVEPHWNVSNEFLITELEEAFNIDERPSARPLYFHVQNSVQIRQAFDKISYSKGASIIRMMHNFLGEETFRAALIHYLNDHQYANADHDSLWKSLTDKAHTHGVLESNITVKEIMDTYTIQAGHPVVTASAEGDNTVRLVQKRFLISGAEPEDEQTWWVPISYATAANPNFKDTRVKVWMRNENETVINLDTTNWYILNVQHTGYYIVNYDIDNWNNLQENILNFPTSTKAQLLGNAMDLARADLLDYEVPFKMILRIGRRTKEYVPYKVALNKIEYLHNMLITTSAFTYLNIFILASFQTAFDNIGFDDSPSDLYEIQKMRRLVLEWSCKRPDSQCLIQCMHMYRAWMMHHKPIPPNLRDVVYCTAIREGGEPEWDFAYREYLRTTLPSEKNTLLKALGCSSKPWILSRYLGYMLTPESGIRKQDGRAVYSSVANNIVGHSLAFDFLRGNWKELNDYYGEAFGTISKMVDTLPTFMNTQYHLQQLESFRDENDLFTSKQAFDNAIEEVRGNVRWMDNCFNPIEDWLYEHRDKMGV